MDRDRYRRLRIVTGVVFALAASSVAASALEPFVPFMYVRGEKAESARTAAEMRSIRERTGLKRFLVCGPGFNEVMYAPPTADAYERVGVRIAEVKEILKDTDIEVGWWCCPSIRYWSDFPSVEDAWGNKSQDNKKCVLDAAFQADWAAKVKSVVAKGKVKFVNIEDDYTYAWGRGLKGGACFCPRHLARFAAKYGKALSGPEIAAAFEHRTPANLPIRRAFADITRESLCEIAAKVRAAVDEVDPSVRIMLCESGACSDRDGDAVEAVARAFAGPKTRPAIRPSGAIYGAQTTPADIPGAVSHTFFTLERTPKDVEMFYEADPYPHNRFFTSASQMLSLMSGAVFAGSQNILFYCLQYLDDPLEDPGYADAYNAAKPRLDAVQDFLAVRKAKLAGVRVYWRAEDYSLTHGKGYGHCGQLADEAFMLGKFGFPYTTRADAKGPAILAGGVTETMSDAEIREFLSRGVLLDAPAAADLQSRGFGEYLGVEVELADGRLPVIGERITDAAKLTRKGRETNAFYIFCAGTEGTVSKFATLKPRAGTEVWSEFTGVGGRLVTQSLTLAENSLGGRVAVLSVSLLGNRASGLYNLRKQELMRNLFLRLDPESLPVAALDAPGIWTLANVSEDGREMLVMLDNLSGDMRTNQPLAFTGKWATAEVSRLGLDGRPQPLGRVSPRWELPFALEQMLPEYLLLRR